MGEQNVNADQDATQRRAFMRDLLDDLSALELMLDSGMIESGVRRIGAEQEMFLVDNARQPASLCPEVLELLTDDHRFTSELARYNLEANSTPQEFGGNCLGQLEREISELVSRAREAAQQKHADICLTGILPTLTIDDLTLENMSPPPRYAALNRIMTQMRGGKFQVQINGLDELEVEHDNVMFESCNTSFQVHFQVGPKEFARLYNLAQAVTGPVLAAAVNSPTLLGQRLWSETRIALFQQSIDDRRDSHVKRGAKSRVTFGDDWVQDSILEIFREDLARFKVVLASQQDEDPIEAVRAGRAPPLTALRLFNGTIYRWNRACYGISRDGVPHLRVENRVLPAGPTVLDEVSNAAFFFGLMSALADDEEDIAARMAFDDAKGNFFAAARDGLQAQFRWYNGRQITASTLILDELLPLARQGLEAQHILAGDIERYLGTIEDRVKAGRTGSSWSLTSLSGMNGGSRDARMRTLTSAMIARQKQGDPVHTWELATLDEEEDWRYSFQTVGQIMTREVVTVGAEDIIDLAASIMEWRAIHYLPVEDDNGHLVGLVSHMDVLRMVGQGKISGDKDKGLAIREVMVTNPETCTPQTPAVSALKRMRDNHLPCLPVVEHDRLVGIVTQADFLDIAAKLIERELSGVQPAPGR